MKSLHCLFFAAIALTFLVPRAVRAAEASDNADIQSVNRVAAKAVGTYTGMFGPHKITIAIEKIVGRTILGYSIVTANERAFSGSWQSVPEGIAFIAREPGDHSQDGTFTLIFNQEQATLTGRWEPNNKKAGGPVELSLQGRSFKYNPKAGSYPQASQRLLKEKDVENLRQQELRLMRNEIYARHGYSFIVADMQAHFANVGWYMPMALDVADKLTPIEAKNAALIKRYETYGAAYYDKFGR